MLVTLGVGIDVGDGYNVVVGLEGGTGKGRVVVETVGGAGTLGGEILPETFVEGGVGTGTVIGVGEGIPEGGDILAEASGMVGGIGIVDVEVDEVTVLETI